MTDYGDLHARQREIKATAIVHHLEVADTTCRGCQQPIRLNRWGEWIDARDHARWCRAHGYQRAMVPHRPDPWTPERLAAAPPPLRNQLARAAGQRPPSGETWALVVALFAARRRARGVTRRHDY